MSLDIINKYESNVRGYVRSFPVVFERAVGSKIYDEDGKKYIDFFSGAGALNYGHNNPVFKQRTIDYLANDGVIHGLDMATTAKTEFIDAFQEKILKPRGLNYKMQFTGPTGTNAVEAALKLARQIKGRTNIVAFTHGFHGVSMGPLAATGARKFRQAAGQPLNNVTFLPYDGYADGLDSIAYLKQLLTDPSSGLDTPAAVIVEAIQGEGGVNVASIDWLQSLAALCKEMNILLILDEIQVGCGRSGKFFCFEHAGIEPDMIALSKSISGYGLPMALMLMKPEHDIWKVGSHNGTFRGNNLAFVGAKAAIDEYWSDDSFEQTIAERAKVMDDWLDMIITKYSHLTHRGRGLIRGIDFKDRADLVEAIGTSAFENGVIIEAAGAYDEVLKFLPALTIPIDDLKAGLAIVEAAIDQHLK